MPGNVLLVIALPVLLPAVIRLRRIKGRGLREEMRCGKNGHPFSMLRLNVDRPANHASRFERILEKASLTELPQLWNVVRGEMALVGPRPESPQRVQFYSEWHRQRLIVKPGITGLAITVWTCAGVMCMACASNILRRRRLVLTCSIF